MRFCLLNTFFPPMHFGGDAVFMASLANLLAGAGHHVEVVHCADSFNLLQAGVPLSPFPLHPNVVVHTLHSPFKTLAPLTAHCTGHDWLYASALRKILSAGFDVTHWHNASLLGAPQAFRWGSGLQLMTLHEYWLVCPSHVLFRNGEENCTNRTCHSCTIKRGRPPQLWRTGGVITSGLERIDLFLAPSAFVRQTVHNYLPNLPMQVLPHFLPSRPSPEVPREDFYLVVARLEKAKGVHTILPLFSENGLPLKIAGAGEAEPELRAMAAGKKNIEFLGRVPFTELAALYRRARATIVPSVCHETFGLVVLESLQQQTPVYVSNFGALPELVRKTGGGRVFDSVSDLGQMLGGEIAVKADLSAFAPETHLRNYLNLIAAAGNRQKNSAHG
jgi:glycosyltransferase involved in cell wall biosynthesis